MVFYAKPIFLLLFSRATFYELLALVDASETYSVVEAVCGETQLVIGYLVVKNSGTNEMFNNVAI